MNTTTHLPVVRLASVAEVESPNFRSFMAMSNALAETWGLRQFHDWSKVWEYPWLWQNGLSTIDFNSLRVLDIGSEISPMPWFLASLGAQVTLVERDGEHVESWQSLRDRTSTDVDWYIVEDEILPVPDASYDVVTSFSTVEHQPDKERAVAEVGRALRPGGLLAISFDICEPAMGMTFPEWNGSALTMRDFEQLLWTNPLFEGSGREPNWNVEDIDDFVTWHLHSAPHHNYTVGAACLVRSLQ